MTEEFEGLSQREIMQRIGYEDYFTFWKTEIGLDPYEVNGWHYGFADLLDSVFLSPKDKVFDLGCAGGTILKLLHNKGYEVNGCDINNLVIQNTPHIEVKNKLVHCDTRKVSDFFVIGSFDFIHSHMVFEHFPNWEYSQKVVFEILKLLRPGGIFFCVSVFGGNQTLEELINIRKSGINIDVTHVNVRPREMWKEEFLKYSEMIDVSDLYCPLVDCFVSNTRVSYFEHHKWDMLAFAKKPNLGFYTHETSREYFIKDAIYRACKILNFQKIHGISRPDLYRRVLEEREVDYNLYDIIHQIGILKG